MGPQRGRASSQNPRPLGYETPLGGLSALWNAGLRPAKFVGNRWGPARAVALLLPTIAFARADADATIGDASQTLGPGLSRPDGGLGEAVKDLLSVGGVRGAGDEALVGEAAEAVGEDVRGDSLVGVGQQLAEMAAVAEHHVADH